MADKKIKIRNEEDKTIYECRLEEDNKKAPVAKYIIITAVVIGISLLIGFVLSVVL